MAVEFATLDFETTGLKPGIDRVLEVGIVRTDADGNLLGELSSLVNPGRDVGPTSIHGISASAVVSAPTFEDLLPEIARLLSGAVLVAHNAKFDIRFLKMELERCGIKGREIEALCTLELMYLGFPRGPRRLGDCCAAFDLPCSHAHDALEDARMASNLLHFLLGEVPVPLLPTAFKIDAGQERGRPAYPRQSVSLPHKSQGTYLGQLVSRLEDESTVGLVSAVSVAQYMNFLDRVLEDRRVTSDEANELVSFAAELGLSRERVSALHGAYVANLCAVAMSDGHVSDAEFDDLGEVASLLSVSDWKSLLDLDLSSRKVPSGNSGLSAGLTVCFTGAMELSREELTDRSIRAGLTVKSNVSKGLDILVLADADSMSGKAKKAREYGVRMMAERVYLPMLEWLEEN
jgi:DNA polymerase-3 subunit epsilon